MLEAELKFEISDVNGLLSSLRKFSPVDETVVYFDEYFDSADGSLEKSERELRIRSVRDTAGKFMRCVLTFKSSPVEASDKNKEEIELRVDDPAALKAILLALGFRTSVELVKECTNFEVSFQEKRIHCTVVELRGIRRFFLEIEIESHPRTFGYDRGVLLNFASELGLKELERTSEYYTDIVRGGRTKS